MNTPFSHISRNYHVETVAQRRYLINKNNGHISALNDSAGIIIDLLMAGMSIDEASVAIAKSTQQATDAIRNSINTLLNNLQQQQTVELIPHTFTPNTLAQHPSAPISASYTINHTPLTIRYGSQALYNENHALLRPMHVVLAEPPKHVIDVYDYGSRVEIYVDDQPFLGTDDASWLNGLLRSCIIHCAYPELEEALVLHAAGISKNNKTLLFTGPSGAGKSTLSSHLILKGFNYLGDDSIPIDMRSNEAFALPTAISLKTGSWDLFEAHQNELARSEVRREFDKPMKTLSPQSHNLQATRTPITALIFSQYDANADNAFKPVDLDTALHLIQQAETKFNPDTIAHTPRSLLHWLQAIPKYNLRYNKLAYAEKIANKLLSETTQ